MSHLSLAGLAFTGFRSFGSTDLQRVAPLSKVHLLAGPNNSGKSNILRLAQQALPSLKHARPLELEDVDAPLSPDGDGHILRVAVAVPYSEIDLSSLQMDSGHDAWLKPALSLDGAADPHDLAWFEFVRAESPGGPSGWTSSKQHVERFFNAAASPFHGVLSSLSQSLTSTTGGSHYDESSRVLRAVIERLGLLAALPNVETIDAVRQITPMPTAPVVSHNGVGLIDRLAELQNPRHDRPEDSERFEDINRFVRELFRDDGARIEVPHDRQTLLVHHDRQRLPIENYGTGLQQVIILAAASTVVTDSLVCVEEPEVHLHPALQRSLLRYLSENTTNRYLVATHSAHLLDAAGGSISAVRRLSGQTSVTSALRPDDVAKISMELGARASDLVQANAVVWVEGPSDRTYIRRWIEEVDARLTEGIHYSIMFYGGSLLAHLAAESPTVAEFVSLPRLNRNFAVVIDSDRSRPREHLSATKRRILEEVGRYPEAVVWITKGYTIENYVSPELLNRAIRSVHPRTTGKWSGDEHQNPLGKAQLVGSNNVDKSSVAAEVVAAWQGDSWPLDLKRQVKNLADMIAQANDLP